MIKFTCLCFVSACSRTCVHIKYTCACTYAFPCACVHIPAQCAYDACLYARVHVRSCDCARACVYACVRWRAGACVHVCKRMAARRPSHRNIILID